MCFLKWALRPTRLVGLAVVLLVVGLAALGFVRWRNAILGAEREADRQRNALLGAQHFDRGREAFDRGDGDAALAEYDEALRLNPGSVEVRLARGLLLLRHDRPAEVVADCTAALGLAPRNADLLACRGQAYFDLGFDRDDAACFDRAIADADEALRLAPDDAPAHRVRGLARGGKYDYRGAADDLDEAVRLAADAESYAARGRVRTFHGDNEAALADFTEAVRLDPQDAAARARRGLILLYLGRPKEALADCDRAVELVPQDARPYVAQAHVHVDQNRLDLALADLGRALACDAGNLHALRLRSLCHMEMHHLARARADIEAALAVAPSCPTALVGRALCRMLDGEKTKGRADIQTAAAAGPANPLVRLAQVALLREEHKEKEAIEALTAIVDQAGEYASEALGLRALVHLGINQPAQAVADCTRALERTRHKEEIYAIRSVADARNGDAAAAQADWEKALQIDPRKAHLHRGETYADLNDAAAALGDLAEVVRLDPMGKKGYWLRTKAYFALQPPRLDDADECDRLLDLDGEDSLAHRVRGVVLLHRGDKDAGVAELTRAIELDPDDVHAYTSRASVRLERHRDDEAIADATAAIERESEEATAYAIRGIAYADKHEDDKASADLEKAAVIDSRFTQARDVHKNNIQRKNIFISQAILLDRQPVSAPAGKPSVPPRLADGPWLVGTAVVLTVLFLAAVVGGFLRGRRRA